MAKSPTFKSKYVLARYIHENDRNGDHATMPAFMLSERDRQKLEPHLSVHSLEITRIRDLVKLYSDKQRRRGCTEDVAFCQNKISQYASVAKSCQVSMHVTRDVWFFSQDGDVIPAFRHRPESQNPSHCGVEFLRTIGNEIQKRNFARAMARNPRFHRHNPQR